MADTVRLNLGSGPNKLPGYVNIDVKDGAKAYPLPYQDGSVDEVRASHVLEHYSYLNTQRVLAEWVRVLKPGGVMRIAVPDFDWIVKEYVDGLTGDWPLEGYLMGGHTDSDDVHAAIFNRDKLTALLEAVGLGDITEWEPTERDCSALPVSLNLEARKPEPQAVAVTPALAAQAKPPTQMIAHPILPLKVVACMSVPRLGFMDNFFSVFQALMPFRVELHKTTGPFWGQCMERCIDEALENTPDLDAILTIDYDTLFRGQDVWDLASLMAQHPDADAIAPMQSSRSKGLPMLTILGPDGKNKPEVARKTFDADLTRVTTAHFGCTLVRRHVFERCPRPWFWSKPDETRKWGERRTDDDIYFWRQMAEGGMKLYQANRVVIGHCELMVLWPNNDDMGTIYQHTMDYHRDGKPEHVWK